MHKQNTQKILIIDDDPAIRKVLTLNLESAGFQVLSCSSGAEALFFTRNSMEIPGCILLDIKMPGIPGTELLTILKRELPLTPVIMLTALTNLETAVDTMRKGAFDYIVKPVRKVHLVETIKKALHYRDILLQNEKLAQENREYQRSLEIKVAERTEELILAYKKLKQTNLETVRMLAETIEAKDPYTRGHCNRVRILSSEIAKYAGMDKDNIEMLEYGALLHDIGKIGITETLLNKNGNLTEAERKNFQLHTIIGENILKTVEFFRPCLGIIRNHHEWYNGKGYPDGYKGEDITLPARIVTISDAFDAMTSTRPYRKALSLEYAIEEIKRWKGKQFDPALVDIFLEKEVYRSIYLLNKKAEQGEEQKILK